MSQRPPRGLLELIGVAGTGKTTAAAALARSLPVALTDPARSAAAVLAWWFGAMPWPARLAAVRIVHLVLTRLRGPLAARFRRMMLLVRGLARLRLVRGGHSFVFDEGPFTWTQSLHWRSDRDLDAVTDALIALYRAAGARVAFMQLDPDERARRWVNREGAWSDQRPIGRSSPRRLKRPPDARIEAFERAQGRCAAVPGFSLAISADGCTPDEVAQRLLEAWSVLPFD
jgi:hypothetical protein